MSKMKTNFQRTADWLVACGKTPSPENVSVQIGCHIEEFCEFLQSVRTDSEGYDQLLKRTTIDLNWFAGKLKRGEQTVYIPTHLREDALDALCDTEVTGNGVAFFADFNKVGADQEVMLSNERKLIDGKPVLLAGGKIGKPEGWVGPDIRKFI